MGLRCQWDALDETQIDDARSAALTPQHLGPGTFCQTTPFWSFSGMIKASIESSATQKHFLQLGKSLNFLAFFLRGIFGDNMGATGHGIAFGSVFMIPPKFSNIYVLYTWEGMMGECLRTAVRKGRPILYQQSNGAAAKRF